METKEQQIEDVRLAVINASRNPTIMNLLTPYGYDEETLGMGLQLCEAARLALKGQKDGNVSKMVVRQNYRTLLEEAEVRVEHDMRLAKAVYVSNRGALQTLHLLEKRIQSYAAWRTKAINFYETIIENPTLQAGLSLRGLTRARIDQSLQLLAAVDDAQKEATSQASQAVQARYQRDEAFETLHQWMQSFRKFLQLALVNEPALLSSVGLKPSLGSRRVKSGEVATPLPFSLPTLNIPLPQPPTGSLRLERSAMGSVAQ